MTENLKKFLTVVSEKEELRESVSKMDKDALIAFAKTLNILLTDADFEKPAEALSDDDLDAVAGGSECVCVIGGGGTRDSKSFDGACGCVVSGWGYCDDCGKVRCLCVAGGFGDSESSDGY